MLFSLYLVADLRLTQNEINIIGIVLLFTLSIRFKILNMPYLSMICGTLESRFSV